MAKLKVFRIKKLLKSFKAGATTVAACEAAGITTTALWDWCKKWPRLEMKIEKLKESRVQFVEDAMFKSAVSGDVNAQKNYLLNRKRGWRMADPRDNKPAVVVQNVVTQTNAPKQMDDAEELRKNADLIGKFSLVDRYGSKAGESVIP